MSITIPHKENALRYLRWKGAEIEELAARIGAVNTIVSDSVAGNEATLRLVDGLPHTFFNRTNLDELAGPFRMDVRERLAGKTEQTRVERAGVFDVDPQGRVLFESTDFPEAEAQNFAVTIEPRGGVPAPTGPIVLVGTPA